MLRNNLHADTHRIYFTVFRASFIFVNIRQLTPCRLVYMLPVRQAGVLPLVSSSFAVARDPLAVQLTLPLAG
jgi:hypothetical protein